MTLSLSLTQTDVPEREEGNFKNTQEDDDTSWPSLETLYHTVEVPWTPLSPSAPTIPTTMLHHTYSSSNPTPMWEEDEGKKMKGDQSTEQPGEGGRSMRSERGTEWDEGLGKGIHASASEGHIPGNRGRGPNHSKKPRIKDNTSGMRKQPTAGTRKQSITGYGGCPRTITRTQ